jgi:AcrR family transcriptional regulator
VQRILDAAAEIFADVGVEAATTEAIAAKAGTSIGSLYQFFPNKKALFAAIAARYTERVHDLFETVVLAPGAALTISWDELIDQSIDALDAFHRSDTGFRAILRNWSSGELLEADDAVNRELARRTEGLLVAYAPDMPAEQRATVAQILVEAVSAILILSARRDAVEGAKVVAEGKTMLRRYLAPYTARAGAVKSPRGASKRAADARR